MSQTVTINQGNEPQPTGDRSSGGRTETEPEPLPLDVVFDLLSNERRRRVLRYLEESDPTTLSDLAEHIASIENDKPVRELSSSERKRVYICLYQCHLPKLDDAGVIDFDEHRKSVTAGANLDPVAAYLPSDDTPAEAIPVGAGRYLSLAAGGGVVFVTQAILAPNALVSGLLVGAMVVAVAAAAVSGTDRGPDAPAWLTGIRAD